MRINNNMAALNAWRNLSTNGGNLQKSLEKLSSGYRINRASDDAAGLAVSETMRAQIRGINMAVRNTQDAVSLLQTAEGGGGKVQDMLQRMRELAVQAGSDTLADSDRAKLQEEFTSLRDEIDRTSGSVTFNGRKLINGESGDKASISAGNEIKDVQVTSSLKVAGSFNVDVTQMAQEEIKVASTANTKTAATPVSWNTTSDLDTLFGGTAFASGDKITLTQDNKSITIDLYASRTMTAGQLIDDVNSKAAAAGMNLRMKYLGDGAASTTTGLSIESNTDGTYGNVTVSQTIADLDITFGFANTQTSLDATATIKDNATGLTLAAGTAYTIKGNTITGANSYGLQGVSFAAATVAGTAATLDLSRNSMSFQVGANYGETISASLGNLTSSNLALSNLTIANKTSASNALNTLDTALSSVSTERAKMGAMQNRLENAIGSLQTQSENLTAAESRIRDVDMSAEMANFTRFQILQQAGTAMLAQANQLPQGVLSLLR